MLEHIFCEHTWFMHHPCKEENLSIVTWKSISIC
jgi:hypothetical protein